MWDKFVFWSPGRRRYCTYFIVNCAFSWKRGLKMARKLTEIYDLNKSKRGREKFDGNSTLTIHWRRREGWEIPKERHQTFSWRRFFFYWTNTKWDELEGWWNITKNSIKSLFERYWRGERGQKFRKKLTETQQRSWFSHYARETEWR